MGKVFKLDALGVLDIASGLMVYLTQSFIPETVAIIHASILLIKGAGTMITPVRRNFPFAVFVIGNMADVLSAAIIFTGTPPVLVDYKIYIAGLLLFKGMWGLFGLMKKF